MAMVEINSKESLRAWLRRRPAADDDIIAARIGMRVFPLWGSQMEAGWATAKSITSLPILRILLVKSIAGGDNFSYDRERSQRAAAALASSYASEVANVATVSISNAVPAAEVGLSTAIGASYPWDAISVANVYWSAISYDASTLLAQEKPRSQPLWPRRPPDWFTSADAITRAIWEREPEIWSFWLRWWDGVVKGKPLPVDLLDAVAGINQSIWALGPKAVAEAISKIERSVEGKEKINIPLSRTYLYDFVEHEKKLRLSGVPLDFEGRSDEEIAKCLSKVREFRDDLLDWIDNSKDALYGTNEVSSLQKAAQKIVDLIDTQGGDKNFPAARLLTIGASLRLFSLDEIQRAKVGATLAQIMDQRIDQLSALIGQCFGHVLARLEPLNDLELGSHDPTNMIAQLREFVERLKSVDPAEVLPLDAEAKAQVMELLRELDEMDAAISAGADPKQVAVLRSRFASRYGALSATLARSIELGRAYSGKAASKFDEGVKWYKRWETLSNIVDWFNNLPPSP